MSLHPVLTIGVSLCESETLLVMQVAFSDDEMKKGGSLWAGIQFQHAVMMGSESPESFFN